MSNKISYYQYKSTCRARKDLSTAFKLASKFNIRILISQVNLILNSNWRGHSNTMYETS